MTERLEFTPSEREQLLALYATLKERLGDSLSIDDEKKLRRHLLKAIDEGIVHRDVFNLNPILTGLQTALLVIDEIGLKR